MVLTAYLALESIARQLLGFVRRAVFWGSQATDRYDATQGKPVEVNRWGKEKFPAFEEHAVSSGASESSGGALVWEDNISAGWVEIRAPREERCRTPASGRQRRDNQACRF